MEGESEDGNEIIREEEWSGDSIIELIDYLEPRYIVIPILILVTKDWGTGFWTKS
jgi:hypothetical protein